MNLQSQLRMGPLPTCVKRSVCGGGEFVNYVNVHPVRVLCLSICSIMYCHFCTLQLWMHYHNSARYCNWQLMYNSPLPLPPPLFLSFLPSPLTPCAVGQEVQHGNCQSYPREGLCTWRHSRKHCRWMSMCVVCVRACVRVY